MRVIVTENYEEMSRRVAALIAAEVLRDPCCVLGLATGSTPIGAYRYLSDWCRTDGLSFAGVRTVNLDEYRGLGPDHHQSYRYFMRHNLFDNIDIHQANTYVPNGLAEDPAEECARYDRLIRSLGGQDLQLLGLGNNGHIGFNEPGDHFTLETHLVALTESTIDANSRLFASRDEVPRYALTMGIGGIMGAKQVVVAVNGQAKARAVEAAFTGHVTPQVPASILQLHPNVVLVGDRAALSGLPEEVLR